MARNSPSSLRRALLVFFFLLLASPQPSLAFSYAQWRNLFSLAHSLVTRVANLRAARGDSAGAHRARLLAQRLEPGLGLGLGFWKVMWSLGWDYLKNYSWRDADLFGAVKDLNELMKFLNEISRLDSDRDRAAWVQRNYGSILRVSKSLLRRLLNVFQQSGPLREAVETVLREVVDGGLLRDCLELGSNDLKGLVKVFKELATQFSSSSGNERDL